VAKKSLADRAINAAGLDISQAAAGVLLVRLSGDWKLKAGLPSLTTLGKQLDAPTRPRRVSFEATQLGEWDSGLLGFLVGLQEICRAHEVEFDAGNLPEGARRLGKLAVAVPERQGARRSEEREGFLTLVGRESLTMWRSGGEMLEFLGQAIQSLGRLAIGRARFRRSDLVDVIFECGAAALPIVTLISFLVGVILAFVGAIQLEQFGAQIYVADLVGIAMARVMGALMTAIIMSGRTGAAFAAQLGTMQVNEEIDAMRTLGLDPLDVLVLPRVLGLVVALPLLAFYSDIMALMGGGLAAVFLLGMTPSQFLTQLSHAVTLTHFLVGVSKAPVFAALIAMVGCFEGMRVSGSAESVGRLTTQSVVEALFLVIVFDAFFSILFSSLHV